MNIWNNLGKLIYWLAWPIWLVYLKLNPDRSRVLVICRGEILVVKSWLGGGKWGLPGGGIKKGELEVIGAKRELKEETGLLIDYLDSIGAYKIRQNGLTYTAHFFKSELEEKPKINKQLIEIADAKWLKITEAKANLENDVKLALSKL